jgi:hypothetical protein
VRGARWLPWAAISRRPPPAKAAADREKQRDELAGHQGGYADQRPDNRAGVRAGDQPGQERAFQRQVERIVVEQQARDDARAQRDAETGGKDEALGPVAPFGQQDAAEPPETDEHGREDRGHRHFDDERRQQKLLGGEETGFERHPTLRQPHSMIAG